MQNSNAKLKIISAIILIFIGVAGRFFLIEYVGIPNFEIITVLSLIAGIYLGGLYTIIVPLAIIFLSDLVIGNTYIFVFTWTAFMFIGLLGYLSKKLRITNFVISNEAKRSEKSTNLTKSLDFSPAARNDKFTKQIIKSVGLGIGSSVFFYLYTNFGWWLMSGMYEHTLAGLLRCYYMAIPFFRNNLLGNLVFVPAGIYAAGRMAYWIKNKNYNFNKWKVGAKIK